MISTYAAQGGTSLGLPCASGHGAPFQSTPRRCISDPSTRLVMGHAPRPDTSDGCEMCSLFTRAIRRYSFASNESVSTSMSSSHRKTKSYGSTTSGCRNRLANHHLLCFLAETWMASRLHGRSSCKSQTKHVVSPIARTEINRNSPIHRRLRRSETAPP